MKKIAILGSTGSIGSQTLDVVRANSDKLEVISLVAYSNAEKLNKQCEEFQPKYSALISECGKECLIRAVNGADIVVVATRGIVALECVVYALTHGIDVALANKEVLVTAGKIIMSLPDARKHIFPIDSEHCAISECLKGRNVDDVSLLMLTASGGPFYDLQNFSTATSSQALKHPNWSMGDKITIDSATMVNKSFEVIEASHLFNLPTSKIDIVVHKQSIVHSMVEFNDGSIIAQMAVPDMRLPIQIALLGSCSNFFKRMTFETQKTLTFEECNYSKFPCAKLGYEVSGSYLLAPTVLNAANDVCVEKFLQDKIKFTDFYDILHKVILHFSYLSNAELTIENIVKYDSIVRTFTYKLIGESL